MVFPKPAEDFILSIAKEEGLELAKLLKKTGKIDEFTLAEKFGRDVNYVRSLLYNLYEYKVVSYSRKKDPKRMWWIYYWELNEDRIDELIEKNILEEIRLLEEQKNKLWDNQIFECKECGRVFNFEQAAENDFKCPACNDVLQYVDSSFLVKEIEEKLGNLKKVLSSVRKSQERRRVKREKEKEEEQLKEKKRKARERAEKRKAKKNQKAKKN